MEEPDQTPKPPSRSQASANWRVKDSAPKPATQPSRDYDSSSRSRNGPARRPRDDTAQANGLSGSTTRLYVGNLLYTVQREEIESLFTEAGFHVSAVTISIDPFTGRNPSYAFVDFDAPEDADKAMAELDGKELLGRPIRIKPNRETSKRGGTFQSRRRDYNQDWGKRQEFKQVNQYDPTFDRFSRTDASSHWTAPVNEGRRLWVGSLPRLEPQAAVDAEMQQFFSAFNPVAVSKMINPLRAQPERASEKGNHYFCFVDFETREEADEAAETLNDTPGSWGGLVKVKKAKEKSDRKVVREQNLQP